MSPEMAQAYEPLFPWYAFFTTMAFVWGACIGSFLNVCVHRIPNELSVVAPRSFCPHYKNPIAWYDNIPLVSFIVLRAKCRHCGESISPRYVLIELLVAVLFLLAWLTYSFTPGVRPLGLVATEHWELVPIYWIAISGLVLGTFVDFEHLIIPDRVTLGGIAAGLVLSGLVPALHGREGVVPALIASVIGAAFGWGLLWFVGVIGKFIFRKEAMGFGDVKLLGAIGAFFGWRAVIFTIVVSSLIGSIVGITLVVTHRKGMQSRIPYGPYLALAALVWMLWGPHWWQWYLDLLRPEMPYPVFVP